MADEASTEQVAGEEGQKKGLLKLLLVPLVVGVVSAGIGFAIPMAFPALLGKDEAPVVEERPEPIFIEFGDVVVNLNEGRMNRYLRLGITLQIIAAPEETEKITADVEKTRSIMTSWMISHLADLGMDDVRGAAGQNRIRREINDKFNHVLFPDGTNDVEDVLFEEFNIQ